MVLLRSFLYSEEGATSIEYSLIAVIVSISIVVGMQSIRTQMQTTLNKVQSELTAANN